MFPALETSNISSVIYLTFKVMSCQMKGVK